MSLARIALTALVIITAATGVACRRSPEERAAAFIEKGQQHFEKGDYTRALLQFFSAMEETPKVAEPYYRVALTYVAGGDTRAGVIYLQKALNKDPNHIPSQVKLCEFMLMSLDQEQSAEAKKRLLDVVAKHPDNLDALTALALAEWQTKDPAAAEKHLRAALERFPTDMKPLVALTRMKLAQGDMAGAEEVLRESASKPSPNSSAIVAYAELLLLTGRVEEAERQLKRAAAADPRNAPALLDLAALHHQAGRTREAEKLFQQVSALGKQFDAVHPDYLFTTGKKEEALRIYERLHQRSPDDRQARSRLVLAYLALDRVLDAQRVIGTAIEKNRKDAEALLQRASLRLISGDTAGAQTDAMEVLRFRPESGEAHYVLAQVHARQGSVLLQKQELSEALKLNPAMLAARIDLSELMLRTQALKAAAMLIEDTPEEQKHSMEAVLQRNRILMALGDDAAAKKAIDSALSTMRVPALLRQEAILRLKNRDYEGARKSIEQVLATNPEDRESVELLARSYIAEGKAALAVAKVGALVEAHPRSAPLQFFFGQLLSVTGDGARARVAFEAARAADPKFQPAAIALAQMAAQSGQIGQARSILSQVLTADPRNTSARMLLAQVERSAQNLPEAIGELRKVIEAEPQNVAAMNNLAYWLAETGQLDDALKFAEKSKEIAPDHPAVADTIGWVMYRKGLYSSAVRHLEDAVGKEPTARRKFHLAMAYHMAGDNRRSRDTLDSALRLDASIPEARAARQLIRAD